MKAVVDTNVVAYYLLGTEPFVGRQHPEDAAGNGRNVEQDADPPVELRAAWRAGEGDPRHAPDLARLLARVGREELFTFARESTSAPSIVTRRRSPALNAPERGKVWARWST